MVLEQLFKFLSVFVICGSKTLRSWDSSLQYSEILVWNILLVILSGNPFVGKFDHWIMEAGFPCLCGSDGGRKLSCPFHR